MPHSLCSSGFGGVIPIATHSRLDSCDDLPVHGALTFRTIVRERSLVLEQHPQVRRLFSLVIAAILIFGSSGSLAAQSTPEATPVDSDALRVMTYNTHHAA